MKKNELIMAAEYLRNTPKIVEKMLESGMLNSLDQAELRRFMTAEYAKSVESAALLTPEQIIPGQILRTGPLGKEDLFEEMLKMLEITNKVIDAEKLRSDLWNRERRMHTAIGYNLAIPHVRTTGVSGLTMCVALADNVECQAKSMEPVKLVFMVAGRVDQANETLSVLSKIASLPRKEQLLNALLEASTGRGLYKLLTGVES